MRTFILLFLSLLMSSISAQSQDLQKTEGSLIGVNDTRLFVRTAGSGEPVIVIHGGPVLDHSYLFPHLKPIADEYLLIFYDQRLSGRSSADSDSSQVRLSTFIEDIESLRQELGLQKVHLLGHSWGGLLAMKYAIQYPSHIKKLMLVNSMAPSSELWHREEAMLAQSFTRADSLKRQEIIQSDIFKENPPRAIKQLLELSFRKQFYDREKASRLDMYVPEDYMKRSRLFGHLMTDISSYDLSDELKKMNIPTLIIYGAAEPASNISGPVLNRLIEKSKYVQIEASGHFPFIEQPGEFQQVITDFLADSNSDKSE
ncbi:MAG: alpha/beta fold hydrolase [Balneolaceae bacterium]|nr:alpha/beta fold hydrolase [Balneolaceae bacterium]